MRWVAQNSLSSVRAARVDLSHLQSDSCRVVTRDARHAIHFPSSPTTVVTIAVVSAPQAMGAVRPRLNLITQSTPWSSACDLRYSSFSEPQACVFPSFRSQNAQNSFEHSRCTRDVHTSRFNNVNHLCPVQNTDLFDLIALVGCHMLCIGRL